MGAILALAGAALFLAGLFGLNVHLFSSIDRAPLRFLIHDVTRAILVRQRGIHPFVDALLVAGGFGLVILACEMR